MTGDDKLEILDHDISRRRVANTVTFVFAVSLSITWEQITYSAVSDYCLIQFTYLCCLALRVLPKVWYV